MSTEELGSSDNRGGASWAVCPITGEICPRRVEVLEGLLGLDARGPLMRLILAPLVERKVFSALKDMTLRAEFHGCDGPEGDFCPPIDGEGMTNVS